MMRKIFFLLILIIFLCECKKDDTQNNAQDNAPWTKLFVNTYNLESVYFPDADTGYVVGWTSYLGYPWVSADLFKTINGGTTWTALTLPNPTGIGLYSVYFTNANTGYAVGGVIFKTINGGMTWTALTLPIKGSLGSVYFTDANTGYTVGSLPDSLTSDGVILQTINGGTTWTALTI
jgi:photosystem II stability/assembly factor-like uncharacterized protein